MEGAIPDSIGFSTFFNAGTSFAHYKTRKNINNRLNKDY